MVKQILAVSRQTELQRIWLQVTPIIKESLKFLRASLPATIVIRQEISSEWDWIVADPTEVYQVIMNLCTNAAQAMQDQGGVLLVKLDTVDLTQAQSAFGLEIKPGSYLRLTISDTGPGIPPDTLERIFEPYFTTKEIGQGTGLGLALVHGIVKTCGGGINVVSELGKGTTFQIFLPVREMAADTKPEAVPELPRGRESILLVDDEPDIVAAVRILLEKLGYEVVVSTNSLEAWEIFSADPERFDLVLTDQTMPQLTGLDLAQEILQVRPRLPVIICTGYGEASLQEQSKALGIKELIQKPITPLQVTEAVRRALDAGKGVA
jgi:CheY-like chemotaxis protein